MSNICNFEMRIVGKPNDVQEFIEIISNKDNINALHIPKMSVPIITNPEQLQMGSVDLEGRCQWSVGHSMLDGAYKQEPGTINNPMATNIRHESERLNLTIEVFAEETGVGFEDHYIIKNGEIVCDDTCSIALYDTEDYKSASEFNKLYDRNITQEYFEQNTDIKIGGFIWNFTI